MNEDLKKIHKRIIDISYRNKASHISSCLTASNIIYNIKQENDLFILSSGHAFLGLACVLEWKYGFDAEDLFLRHGTHPKRNIKDKVFFSTGSLGHGICASVGFALSNRNRDVYCLCSDGECGEPNIFSALKLVRNFKLNNFKVYFNINGFSAYDQIDYPYLSNILTTIWNQSNIRFTNLQDFPILDGIQGHYKVLSENEYKKLI